MKRSLRQIHKFLTNEAKSGYGYSGRSGLPHKVAQWATQARKDNISNEIIEPITKSLLNYPQYGTELRESEIQRLTRYLSDTIENSENNSTETKPQETVQEPITGSPRHDDGRGLIQVIGDLPLVSLISISLGLFFVWFPFRNWWKHFNIDDFLDDFFILAFWFLFCFTVAKVLANGIVGLLINSFKRVSHPNNAGAGFPGQSIGSRSRGTILGAIFMFIIFSFLCGWLPILGPFIAGLFGGRAAGSVSKAIVAVSLPGILLGSMLYGLASSLSGYPLIGAIAGAGGFALMMSGTIPLFLGAIVGAVFSNK